MIWLIAVAFLLCVAALVVLIVVGATSDMPDIEREYDA